METTSILLILLAVLLSFIATWFLYFYKNFQIKKVDYLLFVLRFLGFFLILLLWINPSTERLKISNQKPILSILFDNSSSIKHLKQESTVLNIFDLLKNDVALSNKFNVQWYRFGESVTVLDSLTFTETNTNIFQALNRIETLNKKSKGPILLISDGNQTLGTSFSLANTQNNVYPIVLGDTLSKPDLTISQINTNPYSYLNNKFPVEIRIFYEGDKSVNSVFQIKEGNRTLYEKNLRFSKNSNSQTVNMLLEARSVGIHYYSANISPLDNEENTKNNRKTFSVEVFNEQTNIAIISEISHPDIGALKKAIETNKQRKVSILDVKNDLSQLSDYQLVICYQPNKNFNSVFNEIKSKKINYLVITGPNTEWSFLNEVQANYSKTAIDQTENFSAQFNKGFTAFGQKDIGFIDFPPLQDQFGSLKIHRKQDAILNQFIGGFETQTPLFTTFELEDQKVGALFGQGIWKWRAASFRISGSFEDFDAFISNSIQYLASIKNRERLSVSVENMYPANSPIKIGASYVDKNYQFDPRAKLNLRLLNTTTGTITNVQFSLLDNSFEATVKELAPGDYSYSVSVDNQTLKKTGGFKITDFQIEEQFTKANLEDLKALAKNSNGSWNTPINLQKTINDLLGNENYKTIQKSTKTQEELIHWSFLLVLIVILFSLEWLIRKYYGKI